MLESFRKLGGRGPVELFSRARQAVSAVLERADLSPLAELPGDERFLRKFPLDVNANAEDLLAHFRSRTATSPFGSLMDRERLAAELKTRFPEEANAIVARADRLCEGVFDLLGYENLQFRAAMPDWHFDPISKRSAEKVHWSMTNGELGPLDLKLIWELNRHQYFSVLGRAYLLTGDERYTEVFVSHLENWCKENPPKLGVNWYSSLEIAFRSISWIRAFYFVQDSRKLTSGTFLQMLKYLHLSGRHIETYLSTYSSPNTHLTGEALGLYILSSFMPEVEDAKRWKKLSYEILMTALDFQVRRDGVYCEQSSHYHRYTTDFYATLFILRYLDGEEIEDKHRAKLDLLFDFLLYITQPNGDTPLFGDDDGGRLHFLDEKPAADFRSTLVLGAVLLGRGDLKSVARKPGAELLWLLGVEGLRKFDDLKAVHPAVTSRAFMAGGFFVIRDSWDKDASFMLINCGPHGFMNGGHAHADALSFVLSVRGEPVFVDSGTYKYASDLEARQVFRSTIAHNCLTVNGESSSIPGGAWDWKSAANSSLLEWQDNGETVTFRGAHNGYERFDVGYEREIVFQRKGLITITDSITSHRPNNYDLHFILDPGCEAEIATQSVSVFIKNNGRRPLLGIDTSVESESGHLLGRWSIEPWFVSSRYGEKVPSSKLTYSMSASERFRIRNVLRPA